MKNYQITFQFTYANGKSELLNGTLVTDIITRKRVESFVRRQHAIHNELQKNTAIKEPLYVTASRYVTHVALPPDWGQESVTIETSNE